MGSSPDSSRATRLAAHAFVATLVTRETLVPDAVTTTVHPGAPAGEPGAAGTRPKRPFRQGNRIRNPLADRLRDVHQPTSTD
jgi:hypothetical protein